MVRGLFGDVVASCVVRIVPVACEGLTEDRVQRLLNAARQVRMITSTDTPGDLRRSNVPTTQVEFDNRDKSINRVIDVGHRKKSVRMSHETGGL
jgi:hypothetical protein